MKSDMRKIRSRQYLIKALIDLMQQKELEKISVNEIVQEAQIARSTFYAQFEDKIYFIQTIIDETLHDLRQETWPDNNKKTASLENESSAYYQKHFAYILKHADFFQAMMGKHGTPLFRRKFAESAYITYDAILSHFSDDELPIPKAYFIHYIISAHIGITYKWLDDGLKYSASYMAEILTSLTFHGLLHGLKIDKAVVLPK